VATSFFTNLAQDTKGYLFGVSQRDQRLALVNSRNHNLKIIRSGQSVTTQHLGIDAPTVAPVVSVAGTGVNLFYLYVYVNHKFIDPRAQEDDPFIRGNGSPKLTTASGTTPPTLTGTVSTDPQVTHLWLYVASTIDGPFFRLNAGYEVANTGTPTWTGVITVPTAGFALETDNFVPDTCRCGEESNGFYNYAGFVPITGNGTILIGGGTITVTSGTMFDGIVALFVQFSGDTTGGPSGDGIFIANFVDSTHITLVNPDGTADTYDGPSNKTAAPFRIWRDPSVIQISKNGNPDAIPGILDSDYLVQGQGSVTGMSKQATGYVIRYHYNNGGKKSVELADFTQGVPPRRMPTSSPYSMANPKAWCASGGRLFYWDTNVGFVEDKGTNHTPFSQGTIPNLVNSLNKSSTAISEMIFDDQRNLILMAVAPSGYTKNYYLIVYNIITNTWNLWFMLPDVLTMGRFSDSVTGEVTIKMGSTQGSITVWPSTGFNEAVGSSIAGSVSAVDNSTHLQAGGNPFPTSGDKLKDRWVMVWDDGSNVPTYQFARISDNTANRLTLDTFIGPNSTVAFDPIPQIGFAFWCGPIQSILGPSWDFNSVPDDAGKIYDVAVTTSGLSSGQTMKLSLYRNFETTPIVGQTLIQDIYADQSTDPDHQKFKAGQNQSIEAVGVTGWQLTDNNEAPLSIKAVIKRVQQISESLNKKGR
jgi:hypothetical protein